MNSIQRCGSSRTRETPRRYRLCLPEPREANCCWARCPLAQKKKKKIDNSLPGHGSPFLRSLGFSSRPCPMLLLLPVAASSWLMPPVASCRRPPSPPQQRLRRGAAASFNSSGVPRRQHDDAPGLAAWCAPAVAWRGLARRFRAGTGIVGHRAQRHGKSTVQGF